MSPAPSTGCTLKKTEETVLIHGNGCRSRVRRVREHERASFSHIRSGDLREGARRSEGEWEHPVKVAQFGKKIIGAVLVKTNVLLVLPNKLAELGAVYDCLH